MTQHKWTFAKILVCFLTLGWQARALDQPIQLTCGGVSCDSCIPLQKQQAVGVGLSLSLSYGTAAIQFYNGTMYDLPIMQGSSIYQAAMRDLAMESKLLGAGHVGKLPAIDDPLRQQTSSTSILERKLPLGILQAFRYFVCSQPVPLRSHDQWVTALAGMLEALKESLELMDEIGNSDIHFAIPDFAWNVEPVFQRFRIAAAQAGITIQRHHRQGLAAMRGLHGIDHCWDNDCDCQGEKRHPNVLLADVTDQTLGLVVFNRWEGMLESDNNLQEYYFDLECCDLSTEHNKSERWKSRVEEAVKNFLERTDLPIHRVVLTGNRAAESDFLSAMRAVLTSCNDILEDDYLRDAKSHTFASAREAALQSRLSNMGGYLNCWMPEHCFRGKDGVLRMEIQDKLNQEVSARKKDEL